MFNRIPATPCIRTLFSNVPIEIGKSDAEIVTSVYPPMARATFSRFRIKTPDWISSDHILTIARAAQHYLGVDAPSIIRTIRRPEVRIQPTLIPIMFAQVLPRSTKELLQLEKVTSTLVRQSRRIFVFDRNDSFSFIRPPEAELPLPADLEERQCPAADSSWTWTSSKLHYARSPRVFINLTVQSVALRSENYGDAGIEELIGNIDAGENSLAVVDDSIRRHHRVFSGVFADAQAAAIFDRSTMIVLPLHKRSVRIYERQKGAEHTRIIEEAIKSFGHMRKFRLHSSRRKDARDYLRGHLTYSFPKGGCME